MDLSKNSFDGKLPLPDGLEIEEHVAKTEAELLASQWSEAERLDLLLLGDVGTRLSKADFVLIDDHPPLPEDRSEEGLTRHLERLVMQDVYADARIEYIDALGLSDCDHTAESLVALDKLAPSAVDALLTLDIATASERMCGLPSDPDVDIRELLIDMAGIRIAFVLRTIAEQAGSRLHAPYRWVPLDHAAFENTTRLGSIDRKLRASLKLAKRAFDLYWNTRRRPVALHSALGTAISREVSFAVSTLSHRVSDRDARPFVDLGLDEKASAWLAELRARNPDRLDFENVLEAKITRIERRLAQLEHALDEDAKLHDRKKRAGNLDPIKPLVLLMIASRQAVAWTTPPPTRHDKAKDTFDVLQEVLKPSGIEAAVDWLDRRVGDCPVPTSKKDMADVAQNVFRILRYTFVEDDFMLPRGLSKPGDKQAWSQFDVEQAGRSRYTFDELNTGHRKGARCEITKEVVRLSKKGFGNLSKPQRQVLQEMRQRFAAGFTR